MSKFLNRFSFLAVVAAVSLIAGTASAVSISTQSFAAPTQDAGSLPVANAPNNLAAQADYSPGYILKMAPLPPIAPYGNSGGNVWDPTNRHGRFAENNFGQTDNTSINSNAAQSFTTGAAGFSLKTFQLLTAGGAGFAYDVRLHLMGVPADPNSLLAADYGPNLVTDGSPNFVYPGGSSTILSVVLDNAIALAANSQYLLVLNRTAGGGTEGQPNFVWYRDANPDDLLQIDINDAGWLANGGDVTMAEPGAAGPNDRAYRNAGPLGTNFSAIQGGSGPRDFTLALYDVAVVIPEPATLVLMSLALPALVLAAKRRKLR